MNKYTEILPNSAMMQFDVGFLKEGWVFPSSPVCCVQMEGTLADDLGNFLPSPYPRYFSSSAQKKSWTFCSGFGKDLMEAVARWVQCMTSPTAFNRAYLQANMHPGASLVPCSDAEQGPNPVHFSTREVGFRLKKYTMSRF